MSAGSPEPADELARRLDGAYADWNANLTRGERAAIVAWQGEDRHYERVQAAARGDTTTPLDDEIDNLMSAIDAHTLSESVAVWRGIRSSISVFGVGASELASLEGTRMEFDGLVATSLSREQAIQGFTRPRLAGGPVLLHVRIPVGTQAAWVALGGVPKLRAQLELLLSTVAVQIGPVAYSDGLAILQVEVIS